MSRNRGVEKKEELHLFLRVIADSDSLFTGNMTGTNWEKKKVVDVWKIFIKQLDVRVSR